MEILGFIKWWWAKLDIHQRILFLLIFWIVSMVISTYFTTFGAAIVVFFAGLGIFGLCFILYRIYKVVSAQWANYKEHKEMEALRIVNRLRGAR